MYCLSCHGSVLYKFNNRTAFVFMCTMMSTRDLTWYTNSSMHVTMCVAAKWKDRRKAKEKTRKRDWKREKYLDRTPHEGECYNVIKERRQKQTEQGKFYRTLQDNDRVRYLGRVVPGQPISDWKSGSYMVLTGVIKASLVVESRVAILNEQKTQDSKIHWW